MMLVGNWEKFNLIDIPISQVTVYSAESNCAQIKRSFSAFLKTGLNEISIQNLPCDLIDDSIRVSGNGSAILHDVTVKTQSRGELAVPQRVEALKKIMKEKEGVKERINDKRNVLNKKIEGLDRLVSEMSSKDRFEFNSQAAQSVSTLFEYYEEKSIVLREEARALNERFAEAEEEFNIARQDFENTGYARRADTRFAAIVVESTEESRADFEITYQVSGVCWTPFYDVRVGTGDEPVMHVTYYGKVRQYSGEDWNEVPLILSTAKPAHGARQLPRLGTLEASFYKEEVYAERAFMCSAAMPMMKNARMATASVRKSSIATEFVISRAASIEDRTDEFKVTIGVVSLATKLSFATVPAKNTAVFMIANTINTSEYPFVAGEASVFLNGTFVNKIDFEDVVVNQKFVSSLGVDPALQVDYKPVKKYQEQVGLIGKVNAQATEKTIIVTNLRDKSEFITIHEQVPRSTNEKIKVRLEEPAAHHHESSGSLAEGAILTKENNLEYTVKLKSGEKRELKVKYVIEYPKDEEIHVDEKF